MSRLFTGRRKASEDFRGVSSLLPSSSHPRRWSRFYILVVFLVAVLIISANHYDYFSASTPSEFSQTKSPPLPLKHDDKSKVGPYHPTKVLRGPPTEKFRGNLLPDVKYVTGWIGGGHTNDFMTYINYIYIGILTHRIPIIGPFAPTHVGFDEDLIPFGEIYDVERLASEIGHPVVEWRDVKKPYKEGEPFEALGGWSVWARWDSIRDHMPRGNRMTTPLGLDVSYTNTPESFKLKKDEPRDPHVSFNEVARLAYPRYREELIRTEHRWRSEGALAHDSPPDEQVLTIDFSYFMGMIRNWEWDKEYFEPWRIASHAHFTPKMTRIANEYLMRHFEVPTVEDIPKFIGVHVRHGDFGDKCEGRPKAECYAPLSVIATRIKECQDELSERPEFQNADGSPIILPVLVTSDERDPAWWQEVRKEGWGWIDHGPDGEDTVAKLGKWYPVLIDILHQSMGHGFVGTDQSTMSVIAARRVEDWQGGVSRLFLFGHPHADDHLPQTKNVRERQPVNNRFY
ncbi:hypothetical protein DL93DRAFT_2139392 [Clavulina sp. PMI_390]|nr:hypothetical protein DL93DRAFT_2139392 [Clavulina sp. PMI_390]